VTTPTTHARELMTKANRRELHRKENAYLAALNINDAVAQRRIEKSIATFTTKVLCLHPDLTIKRVRVVDRTRLAFKCSICKSYILTEITNQALTEVT